MSDFGYDMSGQRAGEGGRTAVEDHFGHSAGRHDVVQRRKTRVQRLRRQVDRSVDRAALMTAQFLVVLCPVPCTSYFRECRGWLTSWSFRRRSTRRYVLPGRLPSSKRRRISSAVTAAGAGFDGFG